MIRGDERGPLGHLADDIGQDERGGGLDLDFVLADAAREPDGLMDERQEERARAAGRSIGGPRKRKRRGRGRRRRCGRGGSGFSEDAPMRALRIGGELAKGEAALDGGAGADAGRHFKAGEERVERFEQDQGLAFGGSRHYRPRCSTWRGKERQGVVILGLGAVAGKDGDDSAAPDVICRAEMAGPGSGRALTRKMQG